MDISKFSSRWQVRQLQDGDVPQIFALCSKNELYYRYCPPFVTERSIREDMRALPPRKTMEDKHYLGYFDGDRLLAVMDFIRGFPNAETAFLGFFVLDTAAQNAGIGSAIIEELCACLPGLGMHAIRLGWVKGNPQAEHFWRKNGFVPTGVSYETGGYTVIVAQREL